MPSGLTRPAGEKLSRRQDWPALNYRADWGLFLLDHESGAMRHPLHRVRPAFAAPAVDVQVNLRYAADAEPLFLHVLSRLPLTVESEAVPIGAMPSPTPRCELPFLAACVLSVTGDSAENAGLSLTLALKAGRPVSSRVVSDPQTVNSSDHTHFLRLAQPPGGFRRSRHARKRPPRLSNMTRSDSRRICPAIPPFPSAFILGIGTTQILYSRFGKMVLYFGHRHSVSRRR